MKTQDKPKKFYCTECGNTTYSDNDVCGECYERETIAPIPKELYRCYLNDSLYGVGDLEYMNELFRNYVVNRKMYGREKCKFEIVKGVR